MENKNGFIELAAAVIRQAITDLKLINNGSKHTSTIGRDAYKFLSGKGLEDWCNVLGLSPDFIRKQIGKTNELFK